MQTAAVVLLAGWLVAGSGGPEPRQVDMTVDVLEVSYLVAAEGVWRADVIGWNWYPGQEGEEGRWRYEWVLPFAIPLGPDGWTGAPPRILPDGRVEVWADPRGGWVEPERFLVRPRWIVRSRNRMPGDNPGTKGITRRLVPGR